MDTEYISATDKISFWQATTFFVLGTVTGALVFMVTTLIAASMLGLG